jgi:hypothetical protein
MQRLGLCSFIEKIGRRTCKEVVPREKLRKVDVSSEVIFLEFRKL